MEADPALLSCLPDVPGPKLPPFTPTGFAEIEFLEFLGNEEDADSNVWKVNIKLNDEWKVYALKMFTRSVVCGREYEAVSFQCDLTWDQVDEAFKSPFSAECRAYGRLKEAGREDLAFKAYGYLLISLAQQAQLYKTWFGYEPNDEDLDILWKRDAEFRDIPIYAIVKELVAAPDSHDDSEETQSRLKVLRPCQVRKLWEDLQEIHNLGIVVRDINYFNYLEGKLIDFSRAWTTFHPCSDDCGDYHLPPSPFLKEVSTDTIDLHEMVRDVIAEGRIETSVAEEMEKICEEFYDRVKMGLHVRKYECRREEGLAGPESEDENISTITEVVVVVTEN
ncbi:kinetochore Sim4 complex subunit FTA2-domain-containing protein [Cladorrhinum sp. PSN332]|nr:kinetochore Sim4 complex subunit FTA2-domain-containing protein [Cladorrhinum sp. PSN332]